MYVKVRPKEREQNCFVKTTLPFVATLSRSSASTLEKGEALKCVIVGPPPAKFAAHLCSFSQWRCVCDSMGTALETPLCVCAESAAPCSDIWACSSLHSQLYLMWIWLVSSRRSGPPFTSAVSRHICPSFQEPWENAPSHNCLTFW